MALKGTLKDFGIADILQLIGQQGKTGQLHLKARDQEVAIAFKEGAIVRAESSTRRKKDLIGTMLVRAELITEAQLDQALETQRRTLQRLGDVLTAQGAIGQEKFRQMVQLQYTETLYKLFTWKTGTYEFEQIDVEPDPVFTPLRAESVLMEGFRIIDEWPVVRRRIVSPSMTFERQKELPPPPLKADEFDAALDDAVGGGSRKAEGDVSEVERQIYAFALRGFQVRKIIDLSCIGEFETCKALLNLVNQDYLRVVPTVGQAEDFEEQESFLSRAFQVMGRVAVTMVVLAVLAFLGSRLDVAALGLGSATTFSDPAFQRVLSQRQLGRVAAALEVYRLEQGKLPEQLDALVSSGLLREDDLRYPWRDPYFYRPLDSGQFQLLPPLR
ncbi:MAG: DUF4388 domain-containing protein [Myxococcaceae bacterium]|nr:DUF4388 domain-containing protein [Myxococcaceae bacterium]